MMSRKWVFAVCLGLFALSLNASASVTDPNIITAAVAVNGTAPEPLVVVKGGLWQGALPFVDRTGVFGDANDLGGLDYVQTAVDDKADADVEYQVTVDKAGTLFLIIDNRVGDENNANPPTLGSGIMDWVAAMGFTQTDRAVNITTPATVYALPVSAGTYNLGAQNNGSSRVMYVIAAAPTGFNLQPTITGVNASQQVEPGGTLTVDATIADDGIPGTGVSIQWTTVSTPDGATVNYSPNDTSADVVVSFSALGAYTLQVSATDGEKTNVKTIAVSVQIPTFAVTGFQQLTACNDSQTSPTSHYTATVLHIRNYLGTDGTTTRRRVGFQKYDISALQQDGKMFANCYLTWDFSKRSSHNVYVYAINEAQDDFDLSAGSAAWATVPGLINDWPRGAEITMSTLDTPDLSPLLLAYQPAATGTWYSTPTSAALDEVMNADDDGYIMLMFISYDPQSSSFDLEPYSITGSPVDPDSGLKGIIIKGEVRDTVWASQPAPAINTTVLTSLSQLSWTNPKPSEEGATVTSDVYFGTAEPNLTDPDYGLTTLATGISDEFVTLAPGTLQRNQTYYWVVDSHDSARPEVARGFVWNFNTNNAAPTVDAGAAQYLWLNNNGDPNSATANINASVADDGYPEPYTLLWEMLSGPDGVSVVIDPNNAEDISLTLPATGTYVFKLTANDTDLSSSAMVQVLVAATPCEATQEKPGYAVKMGDLNDDCYVNLSDLQLMAENWLDTHDWLGNIYLQ